MHKAPIAEKIVHTTQIHGITLEDNYAWMRDYGWPGSVTDPKILKHLEQENAYAASFFDENAQLKEKIFQELKGRIKLADQSTYVKKDNYYYYTRTEEDKNHPIYCRKIASLEAQEEIILDANKVAEGKKFAKVESLSLSPDHKLLAYSVDFTGGEKNTIRVLDLESRDHLPHEIHDALGNLEGNGHIVWHHRLPAFFYTHINNTNHML